MLPILAEQLTQRFYAWERRGRGWDVFDFPVHLEPEFHPFFGHFAPSVANTQDDGKRHTILSSFAGLFSRKKASEDIKADWAEIPPVQAYKYEGDDSLVGYRIVFPKEEKLEVSDMKQLLIMLSYTEHPISFEIVGTVETISILIVCRASDTVQVYEQVRAYFPTAIVSRSDARIEILKSGTIQTCVIDLGLSEECMRPLATADDVHNDPYIGLYGALEHIASGERAALQILFHGAVNPWSESMLRSVSDNEGGSFFADAPEMVKLTQQKTTTPLFAVCIRAIGQAPDSKRAITITESIVGALIHLTKSKSNRLQPLSQSAYPLDVLIDDVLLRQSHRIGMLLNTGELATLCHFPTEEIRTAKAERDIRKTKAVPQSATGHPFILGNNVHHGEVRSVSVPASMRLRHTHVIGATGTGKSTLLLSMIAQDMQQGNGIAVLDPHGDLIEAALAYIPEERIKDVIIVDPADGDYPVAFNVLSAHSEIEKDILSSDLVAAFRRLSTSWGDQMNSVLANAILVFLESSEGGTLVDLRRFLIEKAFRETYLKTVQDPHVVYYWQHEYPLLKSNSIGSILTRLDTFLRPKLIRNMVAQKKGLDFESVLDSKKILLVKLSQGLIGAENSFLLGTFFVSKMYQAAMARQARSKDNRSDFFLYIDEFQNFITPSMSHILSGARKYHLGLILAHQDMQQLQKYDTELASSVVVNAGTRICFRLGDTDAKRFAGGFSYFEASDLENLHTGEAIARIEQPNFDFNLSTIPLSEITLKLREARTYAALAASRARYGTQRDSVEQEMFQGEKVTVVAQSQPVEPEKVEVPEQPTIPPPAPFIPIEIPKKAPPTQKVETQHRYLQTLIKKMAESRGYKTTIEELTPDGKGRVDVSLERAGKKIAVEISVTTSDEWEAHNAEKCLSAGYDEVIVCSGDTKHLQKIRVQLQSKLSKEQLTKILTLDSHEVIQYLDKQIVQASSTEKVIKGYRVKVEYDATTSEEMSKKQDQIVKAVSNSRRKNSPS